MTDTRTADRIDRLSLAVSIAAKLKPVVDDPHVKAEFKRIEAAMVEAIIASKTMEQRDTAVAELKAWRSVMVTLTRFVATGTASAEKLTELHEQQQKDKIDAE